MACENHGHLRAGFLPSERLLLCYDPSSNDDNRRITMTQADEGTARRRPASLPAPYRRILRYLLAYAVLATATLVAGLQHFVLTLPQATTGAIQYTDGIVVVTGGQQRLDDGLELLTAGKAERMLISGVGEGVNRAVLVQELGLDDREAGALFCCVELDFTADNTRGNAAATKQWAGEHGMRSVRLVTASYHMPRALVVFAREMPDLDIYQWAVMPEDLQIQNWWFDRAMFRLLSREYVKYLAETISI